MNAALYPKCDGLSHPGRFHHGRGRARITMTCTCPRCGFAQSINLCRERAEYLEEVGVNSTEGCDRCGFAGAYPDVVFAPILAEAPPATSGAPDPLRAPSLHAVAASDELIEAYAAYLAGRQLSPGTIALRRRHLGYLAEAHPDVLGITAGDVEAFAHRYAGHAPETLKSIMATLRGFYRWAHKRGRVDMDLAFLLEPPRVPKRRARIADEHDVLALAAAADAETRAMLLLGLLGGLRLSEIAQIRAEDRKDGWLTIIGKGNKQRRIKEPAQLARALNDVQGERANGYLFPGRTRGGRRDIIEGQHVNISTVHKRIRAAAGVNPHALRHAAGTALYDETKDLRLTQEFLGHGSPVTTQIYTHIEDDRLERAAQAMTTRASATSGDTSHTNTNQA